MLWSLVLQSWKDFMSSLTEPRGEWALQWVPVQVRETFLRTWVRKIRETPLPLIWCGYSCSGKGVFYRNSKLFTFQRKGKGKKKKRNSKTVLQHLLAWSESASALGICAGLFPLTEMIFLGHLSVCAFSPTVTSDESLFFMQLHFGLVPAQSCA